MTTFSPFDKVFCATGTFQVCAAASTGRAVNRRICFIGIIHIMLLPMACVTRGTILHRFSGSAILILMERLRNKRALITGGTTGIGFETARQFVSEGARVAVTGKKPATLGAARRELGSDV